MRRKFAGATPQRNRIIGFGLDEGPTTKKPLGNSGF